MYKIKKSLKAVRWQDKKNYVEFGLNQTQSHKTDL